MNTISYTISDDVVGNVNFSEEESDEEMLRKLDYLRNSILTKMDGNKKSPVKKLTVKRKKTTVRKKEKPRMVESPTVVEPVPEETAVESLIHSPEKEEKKPEPKEPTFDLKKKLIELGIVRKRDLSKMQQLLDDLVNNGKTIDMKYTTELQLVTTTQQHLDMIGMILAHEDEINATLMKNGKFKQSGFFLKYE
jgi:hypothetical protein